MGCVCRSRAEAFVLEMGLARGARLLDTAQVKTLIDQSSVRVHLGQIFIC